MRDFIYLSMFAHIVSKNIEEKNVLIKACVKSNTAH